MVCFCAVGLSVCVCKQTQECFKKENTKYEYKSFRKLSRVKAKLLCTLLLKFWYCTIGYDVICSIVRGFSIR